ncbi:MULTISPECIES: LacI family DNA-binding transcriptional regulator [Actinomyces]|uniref:LacI family DNA-binding transcriptional regulator n=1 Tax=Actinomyces TaxID=1654 RepID=UPI000931A37E|nr:MULTISPECIES: LacI family DNA-binding transcriptional regulator [Actinomyces]
MATITDVARLAGVSKNTVSRYLNERGYISDKTRRAIASAIDELHYQPNQIARSLYTRRTNLVGLVIPNVEHPFFAAVTSRIEDELDSRGYKMILCNTLHSTRKERQYIDMLTANKVDGIIIGSHSIDIDYSEVAAPVVALDRYLADDIPVVASDHAEGGRIAAQAFIDRHCHKVAQLVASGRVRTPSNLRHEAFSNAMRLNGITCITHELQLNQFQYSTYIETAKQVLDEYPGLDGVFSADPVAVAVQQEVLRRGMSVPEDVFVYGYDGTYLAEAVFPQLPSIAQDFSALAQKAVEVLLMQIGGGEFEQLQYVVPLAKG